MNNNVNINRITSGLKNENMAHFDVKIILNFKMAAQIKISKSNDPYFYFFF